MVWKSNWISYLVDTVVQSVSRARLCVTPCTAGFPGFHYFPQFALIHVLWITDAIWPYLPLLPTSPCAFNHYQHRGLVQWVSSLKQVAEVLSFSFSIRPSNEYSGLISFRIDWFDILAVQGTLKSLLQHHNLKASILWCSAFFFFLKSAFFMVQLSHPYMTVGPLLAKWCLYFLILCLGLS